MSKNWRILRVQKNNEFVFAVITQHYNQISHTTIFMSNFQFERQFIIHHHTLLRCHSRLQCKKKDGYYCYFVCQYEYKKLLEPNYRHRTVWNEFLRILKNAKFIEFSRISPHKLTNTRTTLIVLITYMHKNGYPKAPCSLHLHVPSCVYIFIRVSACFIA